MSVFTKRRARRVEQPVAASIDLEAGKSELSKADVLSESSGRNSLISSEMRGWSVEYAELRMLKKIGEGSFGKVYLASWNESHVAVKVLIDKSDASSGLWMSSLSAHSLDVGSGLSKSTSGSLLSDLQHEAGLVAALRHPNIVFFMGVCTSPPSIITEFCSRGSLLDVLRAARASSQAAAELTWVRRLGMALDAAQGMNYLHNRAPPVIHRDLKSPNLLVDQAWRCKVCDFNMSRLMHAAPAASSSAGVTNARWLAPEVLDGQGSTPASDVFSFGTVMWELLTWQLPWGSMQPWTITKQVLSGTTLVVPTAAKLPGPALPALGGYELLMRRCWARDPADRPSFAAIVRALRSELESQGEAGTAMAAAAAAAGNAPPPEAAAAPSHHIFRMESPPGSPKISESSPFH
jgi:serine/threonine protein kinase